MVSGTVPLVVLTKGNLLISIKISSDTRYLHSSGLIFFFKYECFVSDVQSKISHCARVSVRPFVDNHYIEVMNVQNSCKQCKEFG